MKPPKLVNSNKLSTPPEFTPEVIAKLQEEHRKTRVMIDARYGRQALNKPWKPWTDVIFNLRWDLYPEDRPTYDTQRENCQYAHECIKFAEKLKSFASCIHDAAIEEQRVQMAAARLEERLRDLENDREQREWTEKWKDASG